MASDVMFIPMLQARTMLFWAVAIGAAGCFADVGCPTCLTTIHVSARDGGPVPDVTVTYDGLNPLVCELLAEETACSVRPYGHGTYDLLIEAPGLSRGSAPGRSTEGHGPLDAAIA